LGGYLCFESPNPGWGYRLEQIVRATAYPLIQAGLTLAEMTYFLENARFREKVLSHVPDMGVGHYIHQWWEHFNHLAKHDQDEWISSVQNKVYPFLTIEEVLNVVAQKQTTLNFPELMQQHKIILMHLSKDLVGRSGKDFLGTIFLAEFMKAAFNRTPDVAGRPFFSVIIDEFQHFASSEFVEALPEIRKYGVHFTLATQFLHTLDRDLQEAVQQLPHQITFRVTSADAHVQAWLYKRDPQPEMREQEKKLPDTKVINHSVNGGIAHTSTVVTAFTKRWDEVVRVAGEHIREGARMPYRKLCTDDRWRDTRETPPD
jgi:hypothetical protein